MRDLYKRLGLDESSGENEIRAALPTADATIREAAEFILLDPRRRSVYDRNRRTLATVGKLRARLGLNLTRFWPRARFGDFTVDLAPTPIPHAGYVDPVTMAWAFGVQGIDPGARRLRRRHRAMVALCVVGFLSAAGAVVWRLGLL